MWTGAPSPFSSRTLHRIGVEAPPCAVRPVPSAGPPLRTAIVGLGRMGRFHLATLDDVPSIDVVVLAEPSVDALARAHERRRSASAYGDVAAALAHPGLEACLVASPTPTHPAVVEAALGAGLHVLCEKPLALDPADGERLGARRTDPVPCCRSASGGGSRRLGTSPSWRSTPAASDGRCSLGWRSGTPSRHRHRSATRL